jgi:hypothetical protein
VFPSTILRRIHQEVDPDARVRLRAPVARPPPAEPDDARLRLRAALTGPPRPGEPEAARVHLLAPAAGAPRRQPAARQVGPPRRGCGREGEHPRGVASGAVGEEGPLRRRQRGAGGSRPRRPGQGGLPRRRPALRARTALRPLLGAPRRAPQAQARIPLRRRVGVAGGHGGGPLRRRRAVQAPRCQETLRWRRVREEVHAGQRVRGGEDPRLGDEVLAQEQQGDEEGLCRVGRHVHGRQGEKSQPKVLLFLSQDLRLQCLVTICVLPDEVVMFLLPHSG